MRCLLFALLLWSDSLVLAADTPDAGTIRVPAALGARLLIQPVEETEVVSTLRLPGRVTLDEHRVARIGPVISGRVVGINAHIGHDVHQGETLAMLRSTELGTAQAAYLKARTQAGLKHLVVDRARRLFREGIISEVALREREGGLTETEVELRASADQLVIMGMSPSAIRTLDQTGQINSISPVTSTLSGTVIDRHLYVGQIAEISDELFTVADLSRVWVVAEAPEQDAYLVETGSVVDVVIPALQGGHFTGRLIHVADTVKPDTRTVTLRMELENPKRRIKPEMLADMMIRHQSEKALTVPSQAVLRDGDQDQVFVQTAADRFTLRAVSLKPDHEGRRQVMAGLSVGERIVVEGAFHLINALNVRSLE